MGFFKSQLGDGDFYCKIEVHKAEWQNATVFAPVLAVACVSGPSLGRVAGVVGRWLVTTWQPVLYPLQGFKSDGWWIEHMIYK